MFVFIWKRSLFPRKYKEQEEHSVSVSITFSFRNASPLEQCASVEDWCRAWARHSREPKPYDEERRCSRARENISVNPLQSIRQTTYRIVDKIAHIRSVDISKSRQTTMKVRGNSVGSKHRTEIGIEIITRLRPGTIDVDRRRRCFSYLSSSRSATQLFIRRSASGPGMT